MVLGSKGHRMRWCLAGVIYSLVPSRALTWQLQVPRRWHRGHWVYH